MSEPEEDYEALGLIAHSYDALFAIRKKIRKIQDITIPLRNGITNAQIGTAMGVFLIQCITLGLFINPLFAIFGATPHWFFIVLWIIGAPILAAQKIVKQMPAGKTIPGTLKSISRYFLDDPIHRRGMPIDTPAQPYDLSVPHFQREWTPFEEQVQNEPWEADITDTFTEGRMQKARSFFADQPETDFQQWWDGKAEEHLKQEYEALNVRKEEDQHEIGARRGPLATVIVEEDQPGQGAGK